MRKLNRIYRSLQEIADQIAERLGRLLRLSGSIWHRHVDRMTTEPGYAQAVRGLLEIATLPFKPAFMARFVADQVVTAYVAILRLLRPPPHPFTNDLDWL